jgi:3-isopropylmalate dehydrogenase
VPKKIAVIPGDGIGREVIPAAVSMLRRAAPGALEFTEFDWGAERYLRGGLAMPAGGIETLGRDFDAILLGAVGDPRVPSNAHAAEILLGIRFKLDLFANVRPVKPLHDRLCPLKNLAASDIDFVVVRENTEGPYAGVGGNFKRDTANEVAIELDLNTRHGVERVMRYAFELARARRGCLLMADKSNAMPHGHGLWQRTFAAVRSEYPEVAAEHMYIDALAYQLVRDPRAFDVIVTNNLFGDIITDLAAALQGGLGMAASANLHPGRTGMFEPVHGSAPAIAGRNQANPIGAILSGALMLGDLGFAAAARRVEAAVQRALEENHVTADIGGTLGTIECAGWIEAGIETSADEQEHATEKN